jgi:enterobactin synthetase component D
LLELPASVTVVGYAVEDHEAIVSALSELKPPGMPEGAVLKRRAEFLAGRLAALHALQSLGLGSEPGPGRRDDGSPSWPEPAVGSITHGAGRALCAVARRTDFRSLGIDAERLLDERAKPELLERICGDAERRVLAGLPLSEPQRVSVAFSAKESLFKCLYPLVQKYMDFSAARVVRVAALEQPAFVVGELGLELSVAWSEAFPAGLQLSAAFVVSPDHVETAVWLAA